MFPRACNADCVCHLRIFQNYRRNLECVKSRFAQNYKFLVTQVVSILGHNAGDKCYILFSTLQPKFNEIIQFYMLDLSFFSSFFFFRLSSPFFFLLFPFLFLVYPFFLMGTSLIINYRILSMDIAKIFSFFLFFFLISNKDVYSKSYLVQKGKRQIKDYRRE